jgi:translation initiation factor 2 subunit 3
LKKSLVEAPVINVGVVGHVDHGKTTLVQALTGTWTGKHSEEMKRGMTIKLGYANMKIMKCPRCPAPLSFSTSDVCPHCGSKTELVRKISIIDAPGHEVLMATMLSGAAVMNAALLVVAANENCPQPQTVEHFAALTIMGVRQLIVVQTKVDVVTEEQALKNYNQIRAFLKGTWAESAPVIPVSAVDNLNIDVLLEAMYELFKPPLVDVDAPPKFYVTRSFDINKPGADITSLKGATVGGSLIRGKLSVGDELVITPGIKDSKGNYRPLETVAVSMHTDTDVNEAVPGGLLAISTDLDPSYSKADRLVGQVVFRKGQEEKPVSKAIVTIKLFDTVLGTSEPLKPTPITPTEEVLVEAGPALVLANFRQTSKGAYEADFKRPVVLEKGQTIAISRRVKNRWRLSGYGTVERLQ